MYECMYVGLRIIGGSDTFITLFKFIKPLKLVCVAHGRS